MVEGKLALTIDSDGKVTGWSAYGMGANRMGIGPVAGVKGWSWTAEQTGPGQFIVTLKVD